ncbi:MAG TPA: murein biosynthesis integral membrane protein MurJ [Solirubrobacteraceae bacterium]|nr:murein biosynthesis integral membrane protein MurJ [Solirubrobacteraceae bacterium]
MSGEDLNQSAIEDTGAYTVPAGRGVARNTLIFSIATGLSRIAGLVREIVASSYFGTSGPFSAFTIAFQVPNLIRSLFADSALTAAFVPVFTEMIETGRRREAFRLASTMFSLIVAVLGTVTVLFIALAGFVMPIFTPASPASLDDLVTGLSQVLFPIVLLLGLNGLLVGILNAYDRFGVAAISPLVWNVVIVLFLVFGHHTFDSENAQLYCYAVGIVAGTAVQLAMAFPVLRSIGFRLELSLAWGDPRVKQILRLMFPVCLGLGIINFDLVLNSTIGVLVSEQVPRAIDAAFRIYMLPQGIFSVAVATVLFPALSRFAARDDLAGLRGLLGQGMRLICLLLIPAAAVTLVLATPITRLLYQHGAFGAGSTDLVSEALFWFSFSLPFSGINLLLTRTFFSLQQPWQPTKFALGSLAVNLVVSLALYKPFGIAGPIIGTATASAAMAALQWRGVRDKLGGIEGRETLIAAFAMLVAAGALGAVSYVVWAVIDDVLGRSLIAQLLSVGIGIAAGAAVYARAVLWLGIPEARTTWQMLQRRVPALRSL